MDEARRRAERAAVDGDPAAREELQRQEIRAGRGEEVAARSWHDLLRPPSYGVKWTDVVELMETEPVGTHEGTAWRWALREVHFGHRDWVLWLVVTQGDRHAFGWKLLQNPTRTRTLNPARVWPSLKPYGSGKPETVARKHLAWAAEHGTMVLDAAWQVMRTRGPADLPPVIKPIKAEPGRLESIAEATDDEARLRAMVEQARAFDEEGSTGSAKAICGLLLHMLTDVSAETARALAEELLPIAARCNAELAASYQAVLEGDAKQAADAYVAAGDLVELPPEPESPTEPLPYDPSLLEAPPAYAPRSDPLDALWEPVPGEDADARALAARLDAGEVTPDRLAIAARVGHAGAVEAIGAPAPAPPTADPQGFARDLDDSRARVRAAAAAVRAVSNVSYDRRGTDLMLQAVDAWTECPCARHARSARRPGLMGLAHRLTIEIHEEPDEPGAGVVEAAVIALELVEHGGESAGLLAEVIEHARRDEVRPGQVDRAIFRELVPWTLGH